MINHVVSGFSSSSGEEAISMAIGHASSFATSDVKSIHIIIISVFDTGNGWKAIARVVVEPKLEESEDDGGGKVHHDKKNFEENTSQEKKSNVEGVKEVLDTGDDAEYSENMEEYSHAKVHIHISDDHDDLFSKIDVPFYDFDVHFVPEGDMWESVQVFFPDVDFYEAVNKEDLGGHKKEDNDTYEYENSMLLRLQKAMELKIA